MPVSSDETPHRNTSISQNHSNNQPINMAASVEAPQYERDLRSAKKEWKRSKDSAVKWHHGQRHLPGVRLSLYGDDTTLDAQLLAKSRPMKKHSDNSHNSHKNAHNRLKLRPSWSIPDARGRSKLHAHTEIRDTDDLISDTLTRHLSNSFSATGTPTTELTESPLYSFDRADTPGHRQPLTLEVFVKATAAAGRDTERLVAREYEVLDGNGEAVRGKRARRVLRGGSTEGEAEGEREDEGFELV